MGKAVEEITHPEQAALLTQALDQGHLRRETISLLKRVFGPRDLLTLARQREVALDFNQPPDWMNTAVAHHWLTGLPPGLEKRVTWQTYGALRVGLVGREDLIHVD